MKWYDDCMRFQTSLSADQPTWRCTRVSSGLLPERNHEPNREPPVGEAILIRRAPACTAQVPTIFTDPIHK